MNYQLLKQDDQFEVILFKKVKGKWNCIWIDPCQSNVSSSNQQTESTQEQVN